MQTPPRPDDEATRIDTLRALNILDTSPEERFDRLTRLAKRLFGVPIALVSLVDTDRQWFKSCVGLDATETSRDVSFCGHAILSDDILLVPDALMDARFRDNPLVTGQPNIRFYAGCPLTVANGSRLGTLCIIDRDPREFDDQDRELLADLARMAEQELTAVQLATMDELTMLSNRRGFAALAQHTLGLCRRAGEPATLLYFDLDEFKQINDNFGHAEGDRALTSFASLLMATFRTSDVVARLGGDEFAVLAGQTDEGTIRAALGRLGQAVSDHNAQARRGYDLKYSVGISIGEPTETTTVDELLASADVEMYKCKRGLDRSTSAVAAMAPNHVLT
jgi:diguanylate cyclase (GGDEF)-like protein